MINELPDAPDPANDPPAVFSPKAAAFVLAQKNMVTQFNAEIAALNELFAGTAYAFAYRFSTETADADPGPDYMRLNNAAQNAATAIRLDLLGYGGVDNAAAIDSFNGSTSTVKGTLRIAKISNPRAYLRFNVTAVATPAGYRNVTVAFVDGSSANPFAADDLVLLMFTPKGDKGDTGATPSLPYLHLRDEKAAGTNGGSSTAATQVRTITQKASTIAGASVSANRFTLPAGTYKIEGSAPAHRVGGHKAYVYNVTDGSFDIVGTTEFSDSGDATQTRSHFVGVLTLATSKTFEIRHQTGAAVAGDGLGRTGFGSGQVEVYTEVFVEQRP